MTTEEIKKELAYTKETVYARKSAEDIDRAYAYAKDYAAFLDASKTEREALKTAVGLAEKNGFVPYQFGDSLQKGGRYYYNNRDRALFLFTVGTEPVSEGIRFSVAHIDSPRLDLKQVPLFEDNGMAFLKTHYYGGIRKYQWVATPLSLHGVVILGDGTKKEITVGEDPADPVLYVNDLLPHLGHKDDGKPLGEAIPGEKLNLLIGSRPLGEGDDAIKCNILNILYEKYGIKEEDFITAELSAVPTGKTRDAGLDRSLLCGYGHDDRVCAYPALTALFESLSSPHTLMCVLTDKEEVGSDGVSGMQCDLVLDLIDALAASEGASSALVRANSKCLSADVSAAYDPNFTEAFEKRNTALLSCGVVFNKYTGARGKSSTNDTNAEYLGWLRGILAKDKVVWQTGELGKVDYGGGGTIAKYMANHNIDTVDLGVPVISMHAPYEIISKVDLYEAHRAFSAFNRY